MSEKEIPFSKYFITLNLKLEIIYHYHCQLLAFCLKCVSFEIADAFVCIGHWRASRESRVAQSSNGWFVCRFEKVQTLMLLQRFVLVYISLDFDEMVSVIELLVRQSSHHEAIFNNSLRSEGWSQPRFSPQPEGWRRRRISPTCTPTAQSGGIFINSLQTEGGSQPSPRISLHSEG